MRNLHSGLARPRMAAQPGRRRPGATIAAATCTVVAATILATAPFSSPAAAAGAPRIEQAVSATTSTTSVSLPTWSPQTGEVVLVGVAHQSWRNLAVSVSGNGLLAERVAEVRNAQNITTMTVFRAQGASTAGRLTVSLPNNAGAASAIALRVSGVPVGSNGAGAISALSVEDGPTTAEGDNLNMRTTVTAGNGDLVVGLGTNRLRSFAVPTGQQGAAINVASGTSGQRVSASAWSKTADATGPHVIGADKDLTGGSSDDWAMVALALRPGSSTTTTTPAPSTTSTTTAPTTTTPTTTAPSTTTTTTVTPPAPSGQVRPYDPAGPWNTPIPANPVINPSSPTYIRAISDNGLPLTSDPDQYAIPVYKADSTTPLRTVKMSGYFSSYDNGDSSRVGYGYAPTISNVPIPLNAVQSAGTDGQIVIWNQATGVEYSFWQFNKDAAGNYTATNGYRYHTTAGYNGRFADGLAGRGAGTPYFAGLVRKWEIDQGRIDHALAFAYNDPSSSFVYPASKSDGGKYGGALGVDLPEGTRLQLNPALTDADFTAWGLSAPAKVIARALQTYGMYTIDHSGSSKIYLEDRMTAGWDASITRSLVSGIPWSQFRVVNY